MSGPWCSSRTTSAGTGPGRSGWASPAPTRSSASTRSGARTYDAFRFFTPAARPRNPLQPDLGSRVQLEQPGCLHASMDLYKWAYKLIPVVPSTLLLDCFRLARSIREMDMRASPYDLTDLGYPPVASRPPPARPNMLPRNGSSPVPRSRSGGRLLAVMAAVEGKSVPAG